MTFSTPSTSSLSRRSRKFTPILMALAAIAFLGTSVSLGGSSFGVQVAHAAPAPSAASVYHNANLLKRQAHGQAPNNNNAGNGANNGANQQRGRQQQQRGGTANRQVGRNQNNQQRNRNQDRNQNNDQANQDQVALLQSIEGKVDNLTTLVQQLAVNNNVDNNVVQPPQGQSPGAAQRIQGVQEEADE